MVTAQQGSASRIDYGQKDRTISLPGFVAETGWRLDDLQGKEIFRFGLFFFSCEVGLGTVDYAHVFQDSEQLNTEK